MKKTPINNLEMLAQAKADTERWVVLHATRPELREYCPSAVSTCNWWVDLWQKRVDHDAAVVAALTIAA